MPSNNKLSDEYTIGTLPWIELVVTISDMKFFNFTRFEKWVEIFSKITVLAPDVSEAELPNVVEWHVLDQKKNRSEIWNEYLKKSEKDWVLFLEDDEDMMLSDFPTSAQINEKVWAPALIKFDENGKQKQFYQMRLLPSIGDDIFQGRNLPDCTDYIRSQGIELLNLPVQILRKSELFRNIDSSVELTIADYAPQIYLVEGQRYFNQRKYVHAAAQYRQLLKSEKLLPFDRLAAVNGLASCFAEQFKWPKALNLTQQSLEAEAYQNIPYLIEYRIYQLQKQWEKAYDALHKYYDQISIHSRANFDVSLNEEVVLLNLAELAFKVGDRVQATEHLNELFEIRNGKVEIEFTKKLLMLCIELKEREKAILYFNLLFDESIKSSLDDEQKTELHDFLEMFMNNEWYEFPYKVYNELYFRYPQQDEYRRRLIVVSMKTNRVGQARQLATKVA